MKRKKGLAVLLVVLMCLQLCACGEKTSTSENAAQEEPATGKEVITYGAVVVAPEVKLRKKQRILQKIEFRCM